MNTLIQYGMQIGEQGAMLLMRYPLASVAILALMLFVMAVYTVVVMYSAYKR